MNKANASIFVLLAGFLTLPAHGSGILVGPFWLEGVQEREYPQDFVDQADGRWTRVEYRLKSGSGKKYFSVFKAPVHLDELATTERVFDQAAKDGIGVIAAGELKALNIKGYLLKAGKSKQLWIEPEGLKVELGRVSSGLQQIAGGTMDLAGSRLWIKNLTTFRPREVGIQGLVELTTWNRQLANARLVLAGGLEGVSTYTPIQTQQNVILHVDLADGAASIWKASLQAHAVEFSGDKLEIGPATLSQSHLQAEQILLTFNNGLTSTTLSGVQGATTGLELRNHSVSLLAESTDFTWDRSQAPSEQSRTEVKVSSPTLDGARFTTARATLAQYDRPLLTGALDASNVNLAMDGIAGNLAWSNANIPPLAFLVPSGTVSRANLKLEGKWAEPFRLAGSIDADSLLAGSMGFQRPIHLELPETLASDQISLPILIEEPASSGSIEIYGQYPEVILTGELHKLYLKAVCTLVLSDLERSSLQVLPEDLQVGIGGAISTRPWLGSTKPLFGSALLQASNPTGLTASRAGSSGVVLIKASTVALGDPILRFGDAKPFRAQIDFRSAGDATFAHCLNRGDIQLVKGDLVADGTFKAIEPGAVLEVGGVEVTDPAGSLQSLSFSVDRFTNQGHLSSGLIALGGNRIRRQRPPDRPNDFGFEGMLQGSISVASLAGIPVLSADRIEFMNLQARGLAITLNEARFELGQAIALGQASLSIHAEQITSSLELPETDSDTPKPVQVAPDSIENICQLPGVEGTSKLVRREYFDQVNIDFAGRLAVKGDVGNHHELELVNAPAISNAQVRVSGRTDRLNGTGGADFAGFAGTLHFAIETNANCNDGQLLRIPMNSGLATGGTRLDIALDRGETVVRGKFSGFALAMISTAMAECHGDWDKKVLVEATSGWTDGICPTWSNPFRHCRWSWSTPEVSYEYRSKAVIRLLTASIFMSNPRIEMKKKQTLICNVGPAVVGPVSIVGGYYPEFRGSVPIVSDIANVLVGATAEITETGLAHAINSIAGIVGESLSSPLGPAACLLMGQ